MAFIYVSSFFILKITRSISEMNFGLFMTTIFMCRPSFIQQYIRERAFLLHMGNGSLFVGLRRGVRLRAVRQSLLRLTDCFSGGRCPPRTPSVGERAAPRTPAVSPSAFFIFLLLLSVPRLSICTALSCHQQIHCSRR